MKYFIKHSLVLFLMTITYGIAMGAPNPPLHEAPVSPVFKAWLLDQTSSPVTHTLQPTPSSSQIPLRNAMPKRFRLHAQPLAQQSRTTSRSTPLPRRYDLRDSGHVTPIRNQNPYGTCWTFSALGSLESTLLKANKGTVDLSEWHVAMANGLDFARDNPLDSGGNNGISMAYLSNWSGPVDETMDSYQYTRPTSFTSKRILPPVIQCLNIEYTPTKNDAVSVSNDPDALNHDHAKRTLVQHGAISVSYCHPNGYISADNKSFYLPAGALSTWNYGHLVTLVGWDDDYRKENFKTTPPGDGAYIVKNSWGTWFGEQGYFYVSYYDQYFLRDSAMTVHAPDMNIAYDTLYHYDPYGRIGSWGYGTNTAECAVVFTAQVDETITAVAFCSPVPNTQYTASIYTDVTESAPTPLNATRRSTVSGTTPFAGYITIPLTTPVDITAGTLFSVVFSIIAPDTRYPIALEYNVNNYLSQATHSGKSFIRHASNNAWWRFANEDACVRALTHHTSRPATQSISYYDWLGAYGLVGAKDYAAAAVAATNQSLLTHFMVGSAPTAPIPTLRAVIEMQNQRPVVSCQPMLPNRTYTLEGKRTLTDPQWSTATSILDQSYFFRIKAKWQDAPRFTN